MMVGELGLDGNLQPIKGALPIAIKARKEKLKGLIVPKQNEREAAVVNNLEVYGMENILDVIKLLTGASVFEPTIVDTRREFYEQQYQYDLDFADVRGQENVKRALEVAAAGGHNLIMWPTGVGQVDDGKASAVHTASVVACRESGDNADTQRCWQVEARNVAHFATSVPLATSYY